MKATLDYIAQPCESYSRHVCSIVDRVRPAVDQVVKSGARSDADPEQLMGAVIRANVRASVDQLSEQSAVLSTYLNSGELSIVGAEYNIETGEVDFFHNVPHALASSRSEACEGVLERS